MAVMMDGKKLADKLARGLRGKFKNVGQLAAVLIGNNLASVMYLKKKKEMAEELGAKFELHRLPAKSSAKIVANVICKLNDNKSVAGIIVQLPLPKHLDPSLIVNMISPDKDVDGLTDANIISGRILPATAAGILKLLAEYKITLRNKKIVLVGFTRLLNLPLSLYFTQRGNPVTVLQEGTKNFDELKKADVVITAAGKPNLIKGKDIKAGAVVVDAGISQVGGKVRGDCEFSSVSKRAGYLTPVPGGVGPMTVVSLLMNLLELAKR